jgi:hypothetical protein
MRRKFRTARRVFYVVVVLGIALNRDYLAEVKPASIMKFDDPTRPNTGFKACLYWSVFPLIC